MTDPAKTTDPDDEAHALAELLERLRLEKAIPAVPLPPPDAPAPPRSWSETDGGGG